GRRSRLHKKIIGRSQAAVRTRFGFAAQHFSAAERFVALLHQPAREHGRRVFFHPLIQERADLLSQVGGVRKPRQFVALQRVFGSGQQELPWRLGRVQGHGGPPDHSWRANDNAKVLPVKYYANVPNCGKVWKTRFFVIGSSLGREAGFGLCSACEGDYEDPERTAWQESEEE